MIVRCKDGLVADFAQRVLASPRAIADITNASVGSTMTNLNQGVLAGLHMQRPSVDEQREIAVALSDVDALIGALVKLIAKKCAMKLATMQQLLTGRTRLPGFHSGLGTDEPKRKYRRIELWIAICRRRVVVSAQLYASCLLERFPRTTTFRLGLV